MSPLNEMGLPLSEAAGRGSQQEGRVHSFPSGGATTGHRGQRSRTVATLTAGEKRHGEPRWRYIMTLLPASFCFVSGALSHLGNSCEFRILGSMSSAPPSGGLKWPMALSYALRTSMMTVSWMSGGGGSGRGGGSRERESRGEGEREARRWGGGMLLTEGGG